MSDDQLTLTQENLVRLKPTPDDLAQAMLLVRAAEQRESDQKQAQERLVMGAFGSWFKRYWKHVTAIGTIVFMVAGGAWRGWLWVQAEAEAAVLERQATEKQAEAVQVNTETISELADTQAELTDSVEGLENKVENTAKMNEILLELQLQDPQIKRAIKRDGNLKKKLEAKLEGVSSVKIDD